MKTRTGFVSNSSSSSFIISLGDLTGKQVKQILAHQIKGAKMGLLYADSDPWRVWTTEDQIQGETWMDNFDMEEFLQRSLGTCDLNRGDCDMMSNVFSDWFEDQTGVELPLWSGEGFLPPLGKDANELWVMLSGDLAFERGDKPLNHVVAVWGKWVIDLTGKQFGSQYRETVYPFAEFKKRWATTGRVQRANRNLNAIRRQMLKMNF